MTLVVRALAFLLLLPALAVRADIAADSAADADYWLERLGPALNMTSYRGVFVYARGDQVSTMRVAHRYRDGYVEERLVQQDGANGEIVRKGMRVVCVLPDHGRIQLDQVIPSGPFAEAFASQPLQVSKWYVPEKVGEDRVAGYASVVVALKARDGFRYDHRLWLEKSTGLLVKSHVRTAAGEVLERFQFTSLEITDDLPDSDFEVQLEGREVRRDLPDPAASPAPARMNGWTLGWRPDGFMPAAAPVPAAARRLRFPTAWPRSRCLSSRGAGWTCPPELPVSALPRRICGSWMQARMAFWSPWWEKFHRQPPGGLRTRLPLMMPWRSRCSHNDNRIRQGRGRGRQQGVGPDHPPERLHELCGPAWLRSEGARECHRRAGQPGAGGQHPGCPGR